MPTLKMEFDNQSALDNFAVWLCDGGGEEQYFNFAEHAEDWEDGPVSVIYFDYWGGEEEFLAENKIKCKCGRLTDED